MRLIHGTEVTVTGRRPAGADRYGATVYEEFTETVADVLPQPGATSDLDASRPEGARIAMTFHWPKGYGKPLKGCRVSYGGREYRVVGDPQPYLDANTPGEWDMAVECEAVDG